MDGGKQAVLVGGGVGQPLTAQPNFDGHVCQFVVNDIQQTSLNGHRRFTVGFAGRSDEQNLGWYAHVEFNRI